MKFKRVAIIGSGPMGLSLAYYLLQKLPVVLVVRNPTNIAQLHQNGLQMAGLPVKPQKKPIIVSSIEDLKEFSDIDLVFIATKSSALLKVCGELTKAVSPNTYLISYQNGFNTGKEIIAQTKNVNVLRMVLFYGAMFDENKNIQMVFNTPPHHIGCLKEEQKEVCLAIAEALTSCGLQTIFNSSIEEMIWEKSILNACVSPVCALTRTTIKQAMKSPSRTLILDLLKEAVAVGEKHQVGLPQQFYNTSVSYLDTLGDHYPSMVYDVLNHSPTEITQLNDQVITLGQKYQISTVAHHAIVALIKTIDFQAIYSQH